MVKKNLEILEFENKATNADPPKVYTRFKTSEGWMSCFDTKESAKLKDMKDKIACVEVVESQSGDRVFHNIKKCYGVEDVNLGVENVDKEKTNFEPLKSVVPKNHTTMYVSYAKDLVVAGKEMTDAINLVKQAKEAFE